MNFDSLLDQTKIVDQRAIIQLPSSPVQICSFLTKITKQFLGDRL